MYLGELVLGGGGHKIQSILRSVHGIHCLFISCYTETERVENEKFRQEAWPFLLLEIARLHMAVGNGFCTQSCAHETERERFVEDGSFPTSLTQHKASACVFVSLSHPLNGCWILPHLFN